MDTSERTAVHNRVLKVDAARQKLLRHINHVRMHRIATRRLLNFKSAEKTATQRDSQWKSIDYSVTEWWVLFFTCAMCGGQVFVSTKA